MWRKPSQTLEFASQRAKVSFCLWHKPIKTKCTELIETQDSKLLGLKILPPNLHSPHNPANSPTNFATCDMHRWDNDQTMKVPCLTKVGLGCPAFMLPSPVLKFHFSKLLRSCCNEPQDG